MNMSSNLVISRPQPRYLNNRGENERAYGRIRTKGEEMSGYSNHTVEVREEERDKKKHEVEVRKA